MFGRTPIVTAVGAALALLGASARADRHRLPWDFPLPPETWGGAGGGRSREEARRLAHVPVVMIADLDRDHRDWIGLHPGRLPPFENPSVYDRLLDAGFLPVELWMPDFAAAGERMGSVEEATDDLKFFICAVMRYTGADRVQILAHGRGGILARLTILKYRIAHWIESEVYLAGPFHGETLREPPESALRGWPNAWAFAPGSALLREVALAGDSPAFRHPATGRSFRLPTLTLRSGLPEDDALYARDPDSPALAGACNRTLPGLDRDGLRCAAAAAAVFVPFLVRRARPLSADEDRDGDGFRGAAFGGPDLDDADPAVYPGAPEIAGDGVDQDCNGCDLSPRRGRDAEVPLEPPRQSGRPRLTRPRTSGR